MNKKKVFFLPFSQSFSCMVLGRMVCLLIVYSDKRLERTKLKLYYKKGRQKTLIGERRIIIIINKKKKIKILFR